MPTSHANAETVMTELFKSGVPDDLEVAYDNIAADSLRNNRNLEEWVRFSILESGSEQISLGDAPSYRNFGNIAVQCFTKEGTWTLPSMTLADTICALYRNVQNQGVTYRAPSPEKIGPSGGWYQINVIVPYYWDLFT